MENTEEDCSPYCKVCGNCGEDGCCPATTCTFEDDCEYKATYLKELKNAYIIYHNLSNKIFDDDKYKDLKEVILNAWSDIFEKELQEKNKKSNG